MARTHEKVRSPPKGERPRKMLAQQLRQMERDGMVRRVAHAEVPPRVEYGLTAWGQALCPALDSLLAWSEQRGMGGADPRP